MRDVEPPPVVGDRYEIGDLIGRGGAADVYRARDRLLGRDVAVKMFTVGSEAAADGSPSPEGADEAKASEERHRREVLTLAGLSHPGLVTVYDVGEQDGRAYFVMQLIEGETLGRRIRSGVLDVIDVVALGAALGDALTYVHRRGVVHRDVKPGNVLLDTEGRAHLSDFGIAAVHDAAPVTATGMVIGTASYLSPEQVRGETVGPPVDVYALGLVLLECLTGRREYPGNALEAAVARLHRRPAVPTDLPAGLGGLLEAMTADDPDARPTPEQVVGALRAVSRRVAGMDAATVLPPALMSVPTTVLGPTVSAPRPTHGPMPTSVYPSGGAYPSSRAGAARPPSRPLTARPSPRPRRGPKSVPLAVASRPSTAPAAPAKGRRLLAGAVAVVTAVLLVGSAFAAYGVLGDRAPAPPAAPIGAPPELPTTSSSAPAIEPADDEVEATREVPRTRRTPTTEAPRTREPVPTTTSVAPLPVPPPVPSPGPPPTSDPDPEPEPEPEPDPDPPVPPTGTQGGTRGIAAA